MKKKKRINFKKVIIFLVLLLLIGLVIFYIFNLKVNTVFINGNTILTEQEIIDYTKIKKNDYIYKIVSSDIKSSLLKNDYISSVSVKYHYNGDIDINIIEHEVLFTNNNKYILDDGSFIDMDKTLLGIPELISYNEELFDEMIDSFNKVDKNILHKISEIKYDVNKRFLLYMNDSIEVYVILNKIENLNKYNEIVNNLNGEKGILYLDTGNYLEKK